MIKYFFLLAEEKFSLWSEWHKGPCSKTCGGGTQINTRRCSECSGEGCQGADTETVPCNTEPCKGNYLYGL